MRTCGTSMTEPRPTSSSMRATALTTRTRPADGAGRARAGGREAGAGRGLRPRPVPERTPGARRHRQRVRRQPGDDRTGRRQAGGQVRIDRAVLGEALPCGDGAFDAVVCALAIHYAADRGAAFGEFFRVLRAGDLHAAPGDRLARKGRSYFDTVLETDAWRRASGDQWCASGASPCRRCAIAGLW
jgi:SAM-dependent methyltransferase